jgi:Tfp pilus assembly protein PilX
VALVIVLLVIVILAVLAASVMVVTQTETWSATNNRSMLQARYAAEAGAQKTLNYLRYNYVAPANPAATFDLTKYPAQFNGQDVVLSAMTGVNANYPDATVQTAFSNTLKDASVPGVGVPASYEVTAKLLSMQNAATQMWEITSQGNVPNVRNAQVQVVMRVERSGVPLFNYGIVGLGTTCGDITFTGGSMDSWDSALGTYAATQQNTGGDIATNGNVTLSGGSTRIHGTISDSSNTNVGNCPNGITNNVGGTPWGGLQSVPPLSIPDPPPPSPMTPTTNINANSNTCWAGAPVGCTVIAGPAVKIAPGTYGDLTSNSNLHLSAGTYNINSLSLNGGSITLDSYPVVINLGGNGVSSGGTLFTSNSSVTINDGGNPANLMIESAAGSGMSNPPVITMNSSSAMYAVVYAPNAYVHVTGSSHFLGAAIGKKVTSDSSGGYSYDLALRNNFMTPAPFYPILFTWSKF